MHRLHRSFEEILTQYQNHGSRRGCSCYESIQLLLKVAGHPWYGLHVNHLVTASWRRLVLWWCIRSGKPAWGIYQLPLAFLWRKHGNPFLRARSPYLGNFLILLQFSNLELTHLLCDIPVKVLPIEPWSLPRWMTKKDNLYYSRWRFLLVLVPLSFAADCYFLSRAF